MRKFALVCVMILAAALMLTGCAGGGENMTESAAITENPASEETASEDITAEESVSKTEITESTATADTKYMECVTAFKTSNSYRDRDMYGVKIIRSPEELESFTEIYEIPDWKEHLTEFGKEIDFDKNVIAADIVFLSSGGYDFDFYYTTVENGEVIFEYELIDNKHGMTDDEAALFMFARIPASLVEISDSMVVEKKLQYPEQTMAFTALDTYEQDMYGVKIIRSFKELESFAEIYRISEEKEQLKEFGEKVDFDRYAVAADIVFLYINEFESFHGGKAENGEVVFNYTILNRGHSVSDDEYDKTSLFMFSMIPKELVKNFGTVKDGENAQYPEQIMAFKTSLCPDYDKYGTVKYICSLDELAAFGESCGNADEAAEYGENIDFEKNVVAVKTIFLSSGSYGFDFYGTSVYKGEIWFVYGLTGEDVMTCDVATLYLFAAIPAELAENADTVQTEKVPQFTEHRMAVKASQYPNDDMYGTVKIIRSVDEFTEFVESCGGADEIFSEDGKKYNVYENDGIEEMISEYGENVDFEKNVVAVKTVFLNSGSSDCVFYGASVSEGEILFAYDIIGGYTDDVKTLYLFAVIPAELADNVQDINAL